MTKRLVPKSFILMSNYSKSRQENSINIFCYGSLSGSQKLLSMNVITQGCNFQTLHIWVIADHSLYNSW